MRPRSILLLLALMSTIGFANAKDLLIFGGPSHDVFLGCISCSEYEADSVHNEYGLYGSAYSATSIFNDYGQYGSAYSMYSVCSEYATDPPVVVDDAGNFYGRLTRNAFLRDAIDDPEIVAWLRFAVCAD